MCINFHLFSFFVKGAPVKKQVRFNMERNREHFYSYAQSSDDESSLMNNINFVDYNFQSSESYEDEDDDDDDSDESDGDDDNSNDGDEESTDNNDPELSEEDSILENGYLVDKSNPSSEVNNNTTVSNTSKNAVTLKGTTNIITGLNGTTEENMTNGTLDHKDTQNDKFEDKRLPDLRTQVRHV